MARVLVHMTTITTTIIIIIIVVHRIALMIMGGPMKAFILRGVGGRRMDGRYLVHDPQSVSVDECMWPSTTPGRQPPTFEAAGIIHPIR